MKRMAAAIDQIKLSSDNTAKIVKTIDGLAFQTSLLALNAAVEAARAGDAGKGFAVVAGEVRNLAMRSAEAAKNTAAMIEESVKSADGGVKITEEVALSLTKIVARTDKVGGLIAEIAETAAEQAHGIEQVNAAVAQMNQVTQQTAANSEASAGAAEELNNQAANLAGMVGSFKLSGEAEPPLLSASRNTAEEEEAEAVPHVAHTPQKRHPHTAHAHHNSMADKQRHRSHSLPVKPARSAEAKEVFLLDEGEFEEILTLS
jgi:hypothetical protein